MKHPRWFSWPRCLMGILLAVFASDFAPDANAGCPGSSHDRPTQVSPSWLDPNLAALVHGIPVEEHPTCSGPSCKPTPDQPLIPISTFDIESWAWIPPVFEAVPTVSTKLFQSREHPVPRDDSLSIFRPPR